jgi:hypothetical protein
VVQQPTQQPYPQQPVQQQQQPYAYSPQGQQPTTAPTAAPQQQRPFAQQPQQQPIYAQPQQPQQVPQQQPIRQEAPADAAAASAQIRSNFLQQHSKAALLSSEIQLACPNAAACGITNNTSLADVFLRHPDLAISTSHAMFLPFLQPVASALNATDRPLTLLVPSATAALRQEAYEVGRFCGNETEYANAEACRVWRAMFDVDKTVVENVRNLSAQGLQQLLPLQWRVVAQLIDNGLRSYAQSQQATNPGWCPVSAR